MTSSKNNCYMCEQLNLNKTFSIFIMFHYCAVHFKEDIKSLFCGIFIRFSLSNSHDQLFVHHLKVKYSVSKDVRSIVCLFSLCSYVCIVYVCISLYEQREQAHNNSFTTEYFTFRGCAGLTYEQRERTCNNNSFEREYFSLGGCACPGSPTMRAERTSKNNSFETEYLGGF